MNSAHALVPLSMVPLIACEIGTKRGGPSRPRDDAAQIRAISRARFQPPLRFGYLQIDGPAELNDAFADFHEPIGGDNEEQGSPADRRCSAGKRNVRIASRGRRALLLEAQRAGLRAEEGRIETDLHQRRMRGNRRREGAAQGFMQLVRLRALRQAGVRPRSDDTQADQIRERVFGGVLQCGGAQRSCVPEEVRVYRISGGSPFCQIIRFNPGP